MKKNFFILILALASLPLFNRELKAETTYDLKAQSFAMNSSTCEVNTLCVFTATVKNLGADFTLDFLLKSSVSGTGYKTDSPTLVSPSRGTLVRTNDVITFTVNGSFTQIGATRITFNVDPAGFLTESDTTNNSINLDMNVSGYDLAAESLTVYPSAPQVGQTVYLRAKFKNSSSYALLSSNGLIVTRVLPDFTLTTASSTSPSLTSPIAAGDYFYYGYEGKFTSAGDKALSLTIDPADDLKESITNNNSLTQTLSVYNANQTDLSLDSVTFSAEKLVLGTPIDLTIGVKNIGKTSLTEAAALAKVNFYYNLPNFDYSLSDFTFDAEPTLSKPFNPSSVYYYRFHGAFSQPGNFSLAFEANKDRLVTEANYANNSTSTPVTVYKTAADADSFTLLSKSVDLISSSSVIVNWKTSVKTTGTLNYGLAAGNPSDNQVNVSDNAYEHAVTLKNLFRGEKYIYTILMKNGTLEKNELNNNFTIPVDDSLNAAGTAAVAVSGQNASFSWSTNLASSGRVYYRKKGATDLTSAGSEAFTTAHAVNLTALDYGSYEYFLSSTSTPGTTYKTGWSAFEIKQATAPAPAATSSPAVTSSPTTPVATATVLAINSQNLFNTLKGKIILRVEDKGQAYYLSAKDQKIHYLGRPDDAYGVIRSQGVGITNADLMKIPLGFKALSGIDTDADGLPDALETALGTDAAKADTDVDGYNDKLELTSGYSPLAKEAKLNLDVNFSAAQKGKIFIQVQSRGEAWYINPADGKRYFLARPADAFNIMRELGVGVSNVNFGNLAK